MARYLITGATRGIGRALVDQLATHEVIAVGRSRSALATVPAAERVVADLADPASLAAALPAFDRLDGLVHCAGALAYGPVREASVDEWWRVLTINVVAAAELTRLLLPALTAGGGTIVFANSGQGLTAAANLPAYAASKHALRALADSLRAEEPAVRVSSVFLGRVATDMQRELRAAESQTYTASDYIDPVTAAALIASVLQSPADAAVTDVTLRPNG